MCASVAAGFQKTSVYSFTQAKFNSHLLKQNSTRTGLSGIYVLRTPGSVYGTLFPPKLHHAYYYYL